MRRNTLLFFILLSTSSIAQRTPDYIHQALTQYIQVYPNEKVYLHTDKPYYSVGDTLWFKAYLVDATSHFADLASGVLYVDLLNQQDKKIIEHKLVKVSGGFTAGEIILPDSLREGMYQLRAYTNWMLNFSEAFFFHKTINIYETAPQQKIHLENELEKLSEVADVQFFPEGGQLVAGMQNTIGFKSINHLGKGIDFSGFVISNEKDTVAFIKSRYLGMGNFTLLPEIGKSYSLQVDGLKHDISKFKLPQTIKEGYVITVNSLTKNSIKVFVKHNFPQPDRAILVAHQRGRVFYAAQIGSDKKEYLFNIPKDSVLSDGIVHLTLFNGNGFPQCERIIYIDKNDPLNISIKSDKDSYRLREKVKLDITVQDQKGKPVKGNFSLAVVDENQAKAQSFAETIETFLLFSSDVNILSQEVKGTIEQPGYYFDRKNPNALIHLDLLLATQGWRRFLWADVLGDSLHAPTFGLENGVTVSGQVLQPNGKLAKNAVDLVFMIRGGIFTGATNASGRFTLHDLDITDSTTLLVQGTKSNGSKNVNVHIDEPFIPPVNLSLGSEHEIAFDRTELDSWLNRKRENDELMESFKLNKIQTLKAVEVRAKREEVDSRRLLYNSSNVQTFKVDERNCGSAINVLKLIQGRFAGVEISGTGFQMSISIRGQEPTLMVDGMRMNDLEFINMISPCDVEFIDIIKEPTPIAGGFGGLISILTRRGNSHYDWSNEKAMGITINKIIGFDVAREFYSPKYEVNSTPAIPDYRSTLYWKPTIKTDSEGKAHVEFWNSDEKTTINVILEGISTNGKPAATTFEYVVK